MAESHQYQTVLTSNLTATISDTETDSNEINLSGTTLAAIAVPAAFDGDAITLKAKTNDAGTLLDVYDANGLQLTINASASRMITLDPAKMAGLQYIQLVADTAQTGDTTFTLLTRPV